MYKHTFTHIHPYTYKYTYMYIYMHVCTHTSIYTHIFHSMWIPQTSTRYVWEAEPGVPERNDTLHTGRRDHKIHIIISR